MKFTVIINDNSGPALNPLIYVIDMPRARFSEYGSDDVWDDEAKQKIATQRFNDIGPGDPVEPDDIELIIAFAGDLLPVADWRE